ncbi:MAG: AAA family ATPase [Thermoflavifilum sp.]|nr:AAA family ATPase [Thermoflavifilum sp.]MCL6515248.1 AAA family ATPase [Alicyclobacillus sp.]
MFKRLIIQNWRNFRNVDVELSSRTFLVGPNASGKSNLLDVFRFLHDIAKTGGGFQHAVRQRGGVSKIRSLSARRQPAVVIEVSLDIGKESWRYRIAFSQDNHRTPKLIEEKVWRSHQLLVDRPSSEDEEDPVRLTQTVLEQITANREFREIQEFFASIRYLHIVPQLIREPDRSTGRQHDPYGGDLLEQLAQTSKKTLESRLREINRILQIAVPQLKELKLERDARGTPHLKGLYEHWRPHAGWQSEEQFSDGTLRMIGLLWSIVDGTGPLLLEEPELSLHPGVVRQLPQMLGRAQRRSRRQLFISTHSRDILEDPNIHPDEVLILYPTPEGTQVLSGRHDRVLIKLLEGGGTVADAVFARTQPAQVEQLSLFGEDLV